MDEAFRQEQEAYAIQHGDEALHLKLREIDPESADRLHANDRRRVIRAMEIYHVSGETMTSHLAAQKKSPLRTMYHWTDDGSRAFV